MAQKVAQFRPEILLNYNWECCSIITGNVAQLSARKCGIEVVYLLDSSSMKNSEIFKEAPIF